MPADLDPVDIDDDIRRIEVAVRSFKRIAEARRLQRALWEGSGFDLDGSAYVALMAVADAGSIRTTDLAHDMWLDVSAVSRQVRQLEDLQLLRRVVDPADARAAPVDDRNRRAHRQPSRTATPPRCLSTRRKLVTRRPQELRATPRTLRRRDSGCVQVAGRASVDGRKRLKNQ